MTSLIDELDDSREPYLCNNPPSPGLFEVMYRTIHDSAEELNIRTYDDLSRVLGIQYKSLPIHIFDILHIGYHQDELLRVNDIPADIQKVASTFDLSLRVFLLNKLAGRSWSTNGLSKQAHFLMAFEFLLMENKHQIDYKKTADINDLNTYLKKRGYTAYGYSGRRKKPILFNENKLHYWCDLASYFSLIRPGPPGKKHVHYVRMENKLLLMFLKLYAERKADELLLSENGPIIFINDFLKWSQTNFIILPYDSIDALPNVLSKCLIQLEESNSVELLLHGDRRSWRVDSNSLGKDDKISVNAIRVVY